MKKIVFLLIVLSPFFCFADCTQPDFCGRACWDTNGSRPAQTNPSYTTPTHIIVHHTGDGIVFPANTNYAEKIRYYWDLHVNTNGWSDLGYNWLIDRNGVIYEGRGNGVSGAHFSGHNAGTMGVCMIGDFTLESPSAKALTSLKNIISWEATDKNIDVAGASYHASSGLNLNNVSGHKDGGATACPGTSLYGLLPSIRASISSFSCYTDTTPAPGLDCSSAIELSNGVVYSGSSSTAGSKVATFGCNSWTETGPERVHKITPTADGPITVALSNFSGDLDVYILGSCDPSDCLGTVSSSSAIYENGIAGQTYYLVVDADDGSGGSYDIVATYSEAVVAEDVTISDGLVNVTTLTAGENINVSATQNYSGSQLAAVLPNIHLGYYLSTDCDLSSNDVLLGESSSNIGSDNTSQNESETLTIPNNTPAGTYFMLFSADNRSELNESDKTNNVSCIQITINSSVEPEDVELINTTVAPMIVNAGNDIRVTATQSYSGSQLAADLPNIHLGYYLSTDCDLSENDILLGADNSNLGSDNESENESSSLTIPKNTSAGTYFIIFSADNNGVLTENDEANNRNCIQITVDAALSNIDYEFKNQLKVFPNPTSDIINIKANTNLGINQLYIYNLNGRLIKESATDLDKINISELSKGIYLLKVVGNENKTAVFRIIKK
ncbi:T9SS type A sorting domain-containing protein [Polaribacter atrinae]|uniref:Peptidoglycan recognition protein family domain-containing protein n=1 Tax=Polaribacter atrinae TaxID=1333662 RepID=A0A176TCC9_9FLAO|nr:T9SS type A sorting domain-containing protein [Polaribacter atrinae]OAD45532.1 hypothetical protein LPB303_07240 [Polaribacter atrinae]